MYGWGFILLKRSLLHWNCWNKVQLGNYFIENTKIRYGWDLFYWKSQHKVWLKMYFIVKIRSSLGLIHWKGQNKARLEIYFTEHEKIKYSCGFISLKMMKYFTAEDWFHSKCWNTLQLRIYSIQNAEIKYSYQFTPMKKNQNRAQLGIYSTEKAEITYGWGQTTSCSAHLFAIRESAWKTTLII